VHSATRELRPLWNRLTAMISPLAGIRELGKAVRVEESLAVELIRLHPMEHNKALNPGDRAFVRRSLTSSRERMYLDGF
jgi:hypothetical protein